VVSDRLWRRRFDADPSLLGRAIRVNDIPLTVVGIMPPGFFGLSAKADLWIPPAMAPLVTYAEYLTTPQHFISVVARLRPGINAAQATAELDETRVRFADPVAPLDAQWSAIAVPAREARVDPTVRRSALMLLGAAGCVLLIACVNVAALMLARGRARRREMAIRLALGSGRRQVVQQLLAEAALLAAVAGVGGVLLAAWSVDVLAQALPATVATFVNDYGAVGSFALPRLDIRALGFAVAITAATTIAFALAPALDASRQDLAAVLKHDDRAGTRGKALPALVVSEIALAVLLLSAAALLIDSFARIAGPSAGA
jgi:predicted lysophospholipase L1 biosynthesis ABC-type transport system permease subunit